MSTQHFATNGTGQSRRRAVEESMSVLGGQDAGQRQRARRALVAIGEAAAPALIKALSSPQPLLRWEAAKALTELHTPLAAPALVKALEDRDIDVRWLAAVALAGLERASLVPLCEALRDRGESVWLREGAHHVLRDLSQGELADLLEPLLDVLESPAPDLGAPLIAMELLITLGSQSARLESMDPHP